MRVEEPGAFEIATHIVSCQWVKVRGIPYARPLMTLSIAEPLGYVPVWLTPAGRGRPQPGQPCGCTVQRTAELTGRIAVQRDMPLDRLAQHPRRLACLREIARKAPSNPRHTEDGGALRFEEPFGEALALGFVDVFHTYDIATRIGCIDDVPASCRN